MRAMESSGNPTATLDGFCGSSFDSARLAALQNLLTFDGGPFPPPVWVDNQAGGKHYSGAFRS
jgi:hypothetical protein